MTFYKNEYSIAIINFKNVVNMVYFEVVSRRNKFSIA